MKLFFKGLVKKMFVLFVLLNTSFFVFPQTSDSSKIISHFYGSISATNNGISLIPSFNLGKPAVMFNLSIGSNKLSFDPQFRFAMEGKPWSFIFWWRYKLVENEKFQMRLGAHPALSFKGITVIKDGENWDITRVRRYLAFELAPEFRLSKNVKISPYYLYAHGVERDLVQHTQYIALQSSFSNLKLSDLLYLKFNPQVYFLKMDKNIGYYFASSLTLAKKDFPFSVSAMINKTIDTEIVSKDFIWSLSLVYSFGKNYVKL